MLHWISGFTGLPCFCALSRAFSIIRSQSTGSLRMVTFGNDPLTTRPVTSSAPNARRFMGRIVGVNSPCESFTELWKFLHQRIPNEPEAGMHWKGARYPPTDTALQGALPTPSHCLPNSKCQLHKHLLPTVTAPNRFGHLLQLLIQPLLGPLLRSLPF